MSETRSCVMGRGVEAPWSFMRIAAASGCPIQIGRNLLESTVLRRTIGCLPAMSKLTPEMTISCTRRAPRSGDCAKYRYPAWSPESARASPGSGLEDHLDRPVLLALEHGV